MSTGNRCAIYGKIDALGEARTVADVVARLQPILNELAYYAVTGEAAVQEVHEEWHTTFTDRLYEAMGSDRSRALATAAGAPAPRPAAGPQAQRPAAQAPLPRPRAPAARPTEYVGGGDRVPPPPPANRPQPGDLSPALLSILKGSHPSFREDDG